MERAKSAPTPSSPSWRYSSTMAEKTAQTAVLGAGILGCCLALALARRGVRVDLYDQTVDPMNGASLHNEGRLHLGFGYANDPHQATHDLMIRGSLSFARIIHELTGAIPADYLPSRPFNYLIPRDSLLKVDSIEAHFQNVQSAIDLLSQHSRDRYLDLEPECFYRRCTSDETAKYFDMKHCQAAFITEERSIYTQALAKILRRSVAAERLIQFHGATRVEAVAIEDGGNVHVGLCQDGARVEKNYFSVANCLWDQRLRIDRTAGLHPKRPWLFRYKATIILRSNDLQLPIPSATLIVGPYGDVVNFGDGRYYLSWYPVCKLGQTQMVEGDALHSLLETVDQGLLIRDSILAMSHYIPSLSRLLGEAPFARVGGGVIFAWGNTDIDDPDSLLHQRSAIGPTRHGSYLSIDTGKYCMGPLFAMQSADLMMDILK